MPKRIWKEDGAREENVGDGPKCHEMVGSIGQCVSIKE